MVDLNFNCCIFLQDQSHLSCMESTHGKLINFHRLTRENCVVMHLRSVATNGAWTMHFSFLIFGVLFCNRFILYLVIWLFNGHCYHSYCGTRSCNAMLGVSAGPSLGGIFLFRKAAKS